MWGSQFGAPWSWAMTPTLLPSINPCRTYATNCRWNWPKQVTSWRLCRQRQSPSFLLSSSSGIPDSGASGRKPTAEAQPKCKTRKRTRFCGKRRILCSSLAVACFKSEIPTKTTALTLYHVRTAPRWASCETCPTNTWSFGHALDLSQACDVREKDVDPRFLQKHTRMTQHDNNLDIHVTNIRFLSHRKRETCNRSSGEMGLHLRQKGMPDRKCIGIDYNNGLDNQATVPSPKTFCKSNKSMLYLIFEVKNHCRGMAVQYLALSVSGIVRT